MKKTQEGEIGGKLFGISSSLNPRSKASIFTQIEMHMHNRDSNCVN